MDGRSRDRDHELVLITRTNRRLTNIETMSAVALARRDGLIVAADRYRVAPTHLYQVAIQHPELRPLDRVERNRKLGKGNGRGSAPILNREQAQDAVHRARLVGAQATADELGISYGTLYKAWRRYGLEHLGLPQRRIAHPGRRILTREQAEEAVTRAKEIGCDLTAKELGCCRQTLSNTWRRYNIANPRGKAA